MRSIRLSLVLYFLVLLVLGLGAVSAIAYWTTAQNVQTREDAMQHHYKSQYERRCNREKSKLDNALRAQARTLASLDPLQQARVCYQVLAPINLIAGGPGSDSSIIMPFWTATTCCGKLAGPVKTMCGTEIQFNEAFVPPYPDGPVTEFFQITSDFRNTWRSRSMGQFTFPDDTRAFAEVPVLDWKFDDTEIAPDMHMRRVRLKAPASHFRAAGAPPKTRPTPATGDDTTPMLLIQVACDTTRRDEVLRGFKADYEDDLKKLSDESSDTLATLRNRLLSVSLGTFALAVLGGFFLVRLGLAPLARLSDAVSRVSEKDFRLQFDEPRLPAELKPIVERLGITFDQLQRAFAREKQAAADISHELRTPLAALLTTVEVSLRKPRSSEEYRDALNDCRTLGTQISQLVERLLALARLDAGVDHLRPQTVDAASVAEQCAALVRPLAEAHDLTLKVSLHRPATLTADPDKLREVLTNLLHNAIEYNRPQGSVELTVGRDNGHLAVEVRDTGIGIKPEARAHIFERFYRADPSRQATGLHAGLGLAIVKGYVDLMGGTISVDSAEGQGSTFRIRLPANDNHR